MSVSAESLRVGSLGETDSLVGVLKAVPAIGRIAVFHLNGVGDLLFSLPALLALRETFPEAYLTSIVRPYLSDLLELSQLPDRIIARPRNGNKLEFLSFMRELRSSHFELAVLFSQSASANIYALLSGMKVRVGFIDTLFPRLLSHPINRRGITSTSKLLYLVEQLGARPHKKDYVGLLHLGGEPRAKARQLLAEAGLEGAPFAVISFAEGAGRPYPYKTYPSEKFAEVGKRLLQMGLKPVIIGGKGEAEAASALVEKIGKGAFSLAGRTNLAELAAVIQQSKLLLGIDSGPTHIAAALEVPIIALYGPTDPSLTGPQGDKHIILRKEMKCSPCVEPSCKDRRCMTTIAPAEITAAVEKLLK